MDQARLQRIRAMLREFVDGSNRTPARAGELLNELNQAFPGDHRTAETLYTLALYVPRERKIGESDLEILRHCALLLNQLDEKPPAIKQT